MGSDPSRVRNKGNLNQVNTNTFKYRVRRLITYFRLQTNSLCTPWKQNRIAFWQQDRYDLSEKNFPTLKMSYLFIRDQYSHLGLMELHFDLKLQKLLTTLLGCSCSTVEEHTPAEQNSWGRGFESRQVQGFSSSSISSYFPAPVECPYSGPSKEGASLSVCCERNIIKMDV